MIDEATWVVLALLAAAGLFLYRQIDAVRREIKWLPKELRRATLAYAERLFRSEQPKLVARIDRAYRGDGGIVLLELKTRQRHHVYAGDIIELSAQKVAIEAQTRERVAAQAYVLTAVTDDGSRKIHRVRLMSRAEIEELIARRERVLNGRSEAHYARHPGVCSDCGFREQCRPPGWRP